MEKQTDEGGQRERKKEREREKKSRWNETKIERVMGLADSTFFQISISIGK